MKAIDIFNKIKGINPKTSTVSSIGTFVSPLSQQISDGILSDVISNLPENWLAYKIAAGNADRFSDKQL